jgi:hypothetical protein
MILPGVSANQLRVKTTKGTAAGGGGGGDTLLQQAANAMATGEWVKLGTSTDSSFLTTAPDGLSGFLGGAFSGFKTGYADKMVLDPTNKKIHFLGGDHGDFVHHFVFDEATHTWSDIGQPFSIDPNFHCWEHIAWDSDREKLYTRPYGTSSVRRWESASSWTTRASTSDYMPGTTAMDYMPTLGANGKFVFCHSFDDPGGGIGGLLGYDPVADTWSTVYDYHGGAVTGVGASSPMCMYSPIHNLLWFGAGAGSVKTYTMTAGGTITAMPDPVGSLNNLGCGGTDNSIPFYNPANGNFIVIRTPSLWYELNPTGSGTWTAKTGTCEVLNSPVYITGSAYGVICCALPGATYNNTVAMIKATSGTVEMWLYKP